MYVETEWDRAARYYRNEQHKVARPLQDRAITREEYEQLQKNYWDLHPFRLIWQLLWEHGARGIEVCWLQLENLDFNQGVIYYKVAKPRKKDDVFIHKCRQMPMSKDLKERLMAYVKLNWGGFRQGFLFPAPALQSKFPHLNPTCLNWELDRLRPEMGGRWLELLDGPGSNHLVGPHSFRRAWITRYIKRYPDASIFEVARAAMHEDPKTTFRYYQELNTERMQEFINMASLA